MSTELPKSHVTLVTGSEFRPVLGHLLVVVELSFADQMGDGQAHHGFARRVNDVQVVLRIRLGLLFVGVTGVHLDDWFARHIDAESGSMLASLFFKVRQEGIADLLKASDRSKTESKHGSRRGNGENGTNSKPPQQE